jgi:hypothetical protein
MKTYIMVFKKLKALVFKVSDESYIQVLLVFPFITKLPGPDIARPVVRENLK